MVKNLNDGLCDISQQLGNLLLFTLDVDDSIDFDDLRQIEPAPVFSYIEPIKSYKPNEHDFTSKVRRPSVLGRLLPGRTKKYNKDLDDAKATFQSALTRWNNEVHQISEQKKSAYEAHEADLAAYNARKKQINEEIDDFRDKFKSGDIDAIETYFGMVLERSEYGSEFPKNYNIAYVATSKMLVIEFELPTSEIVPKAAEYRYIKSKDEINIKEKKQSEIKEIYSDIVAAIALRTMHEIFESDTPNHCDLVCFNGFVKTIDPATGQDIEPHLVSVRATKNQFTEIDLRRVDKKVCLRNLGAQVSRSPEESQPIKPIIDFNMVDRRFVEQADLVSSLTNAENLMTLSPTEFEILVANLFGKNGLETKLTRSTKDGGVDCVAFDKRPVLGGKVVIQAKRYSNTVGVSAVRDLYGTMMNEGANKGILVTTSGYGPDAYTFASNKPIELIDGGGLLYLLREIGYEARIIFINS